MHKPLTCNLWKVASALLFLGAAYAGAQQAHFQDKLVAYQPGGEVKAARLIKATPVQLPPGEILASGKHVTALSLVVESDGRPGNFVVLNSKPSPLDDMAIAAVKQSTFQPGSRNGEPIRVQELLWVPFLDPQRPIVPVQMGSAEKGFDLTQPKATNNVEAEFSDQARREGVSGTVMVRVLVSDQGLPIDANVATSVGHGLDEEALKAVRQYRFEPATLGDIPVPTSIMVEISFRLYNRR